MVRAQTKYFEKVFYKQLEILDARKLFSNLIYNGLN